MRMLIELMPGIVAAVIACMVYVWLLYQVKYKLYVLNFTQMLLKELCGNAGGPGAGSRFPPLTLKCSYDGISAMIMHVWGTYN